MVGKRRVEVALLIFFGAAAGGVTRAGPARLAGGPVTIWSDGLETGDFSGWSGASGNWNVITSSAAAHSGSRGADITGPTGDDVSDASVLLLSFPTSGYRDLNLEYWWRVRENVDSSDFLLLQITHDGVDWENLTQYTSEVVGDWQFASFSLPDENENNPNFGFRLRAHFDSGGDRMAFDDFVLSGTPVPEPATLFLLL